jgi:hypothetical protein
MRLYDRVDRNPSSIYRLEKASFENVWRIGSELFWGPVSFKKMTKSLANGSPKFSGLAICGHSKRFAFLHWSHINVIASALNIGAPSACFKSIICKQYFRKSLNTAFNIVNIHGTHHRIITTRIHRRGNADKSRVFDEEEGGDRFFEELRRNSERGVCAFR